MLDLVTLLVFFSGLIIGVLCHKAYVRDKAELDR